MSNLIVQAVPAEQTGVASGMNANIRTIGGAIGAAVMSSIVVAGVRSGQLPKESGYTHGFFVLTLAAIGAAVASFFVPAVSKYRARATEPTRRPSRRRMGSLACWRVGLWWDTSPSEMRAAVPAVPAIGAPRPLRRDAAENRSRLLAAASQVFDEQGLDAGVEEIARVAGVGMGTLYRRFPTKDALIDALVTDLLDAMIELAREAALRPDGLGLEYFLEGASDYQARNPGCLPRLWRGPDNGLVKIARGLISELLEDANATAAYAMT